VALLISADLFACGIVTLIQSLDFGRFFGIRLLRFFPPVVTGTIIAIIGISLMRVGVGWAVGGPAQLAEAH